MPALVNAHTHLSLSVLAGKLPLGDGFAAWIQALLSERRGVTEEEALQAIHGAVGRNKTDRNGIGGRIRPPLSRGGIH